MEDKKNLIIAAAIMLVLILITGIGIGLFFYLKQFAGPAPAPIEPGVNINANVPAFLPPAPPTPTTTQQVILIEELEKDKQFISSFWKPLNVKYTAQAPQYELPIESIKEKIANYRDFSRKIDVEPILAKLSENGFVVIANPFDLNLTDWQNSYEAIENNELPALVTADSVIGLYQDTLNVIYKEIELETFYSSLWDLLEQMFNQTKARYEAKSRQYGIETNILTEANRQELAYLSVALKLLQPQPNQIKESIGINKEFFSSQEAKRYAVLIPTELENEVNEEIKLINSKAKNVKSPIFLYQKNYDQYAIPKQYSTSERLKNYYLAITWLQDILLPLWSQDDDCPDCLNDREDHTINFIASILLTDDLAKDRILKNLWANIYKSISFFKGVEGNLTYLDYYQAIKYEFSEEYDLEKIFDTDIETTKENINKLQQRINTYEFRKALTVTPDTKDEKGLKLLRDYHLFENNLFYSLSSTSTGKYTQTVERGDAIPSTACAIDKIYYRCFPTALDLFNVLGIAAAKNVLEETKNSDFENYNQEINNYINDELQEFDKNTWHDNSYLALLSALKYLEAEKTPGFPTFMQNDAWAKKSLSTGLGAWVNFHKEISFIRESEHEEAYFLSQFSYGYLEPQIEFYQELLADVEMIMEGFAKLKIISPNSKSFERLVNLKTTLEETIKISKKELENSELSVEDYGFINGFHKHIRSIVGDIKKENLQNSCSLSYGNRIDKRTYDSKSQIKGLDYIIVIYPSQDGKIFFAIGPVFSYYETNGIESDWQKKFK